MVEDFSSEFGFFFFESIFSVILVIIDNIWMFFGLVENFFEEVI